MGIGRGMSGYRKPARRSSRPGRPKGGSYPPTGRTLSAREREVLAWIVTDPLWKRDGGTSV